jgi:hypothetical protein
MAGFLDTMKKLIDGFKALPKRFKSFGSGMTATISGVGLGIWGTFKSLGIGTTSITMAIYEVLKLIYKYSVCFFVFMYNLPYCFITHIIMLVFYLFYYLCFELPILILAKVTGLNLRPHVNELFKILYTGDDFLYQVAGFHILRLPPKIVKRCYTCQGKTIGLNTVLRDREVFDKVGRNITRDFKVKIPNTMRPATRNMQKARTDFKKAFS